MKGQIIVDGTGQKQIYLAEASMCIYSEPNASNEWVVYSVEVDERRLRVLRQTHKFTRELDVPQEIVNFAFQKCGSRHWLGHMLGAAARDGEKIKSGELIKRLRLARQETQCVDPDEHDIGATIDALIQKGGLN